MFTAITYEDWLAAPADKRDLLKEIISKYRASDDFKAALTAQAYFAGNNEEIQNKYVVQLGSYEQKVPVLDPDTGEKLLDVNGNPVMETRTIKKETKVAGTRIASGFFFRFVTQQNQHLLGNGVTLKDASQKERLGRGFDTALASMGEKALIDGVCWGFWNHDHLEVIRAAVDASSGAVALLSEADASPRVLVQFWRLGEKKPQHVRVFAPDAIYHFRSDEDGELVELDAQAYITSTTRDNLGNVSTRVSDYHGMLPVIPLYGNPEHRSELTESIKSKIDCFDRIASDFGDNLQMANDVFWVLNNFGGSTKDVLATLAQIKELRAVVNISDGTGSGSTAEPHSFEVPYAARQTALEILRRELYRDYMALDTEALTGGSLTNVAIRVAVKDLNLKCDRAEWCAFAFVQSVLRLQGIETEDISFTRQSMENETETIENIYRAAEDLDRETRLKLNPMIMQDMIPQIMENKAAEEMTGLASLRDLQDELDRANQEGREDDAGQS